MVKLAQSNISTYATFYAILGFSISGIFLILVSYTGCEQTILTVAFMCIAIAGRAFSSSGGFRINHLDIAPQYAGVLMGITNCFATSAGIISPYLVGVIVDISVSTFLG